MTQANRSMKYSAQKLVDLVTEFVDNVVERCHDRYGTEETPLLTDGIDLETGQPTKWEGHILSNLACQQIFLRTLHGLAFLTGGSKYQKYASEWISYALSVLQDSESGMLYWGGHTNYDLLEDRPLIGNHELKCVYPYYSYLYEVDPEATRFLIGGFWNKHIKDWSNLLFNRHGEYNSWDRESPWEHDYSGGPLPIVDNTMLSFINTGSDLIYSGAMLTKLSGDGSPLVWAKRLAGRYDEIRHETTGLGGYQFNHREPCRVRISFREPLSERPDVNETTVITNGVIQTRYGRAALTWLNLFEVLGAADGQIFLDIASRDLVAIGEHSYDFSDHSFTPLLVDGMKLSPSDCMEGVGYCSPRSLGKVPANGLMFLVYAKAYRITRNPFFWKMTRSLAQGLGWGEVFDTSLTKIGRSASDQNHTCALLGLIELYKATEQEQYLDSASALADQLAQKQFTDGFFTTGAEPSKGYSNINSSLPLALLHLAVTTMGRDTDIPTFYPGSTSFDPKVIIARQKRS